MINYDLKVGYTCNNHCIHCVISDSKDNLLKNKLPTDLTTEECFNQISFAVEQGAKFIILTGGEVTLRKDFPLLLEYCKDKNLEITLQTNGRRLYVPEVLNAICNQQKIRCVVALHGSNANTHDAITLAKGSFEETCRGLTALCKKNKLIILKVVISKKNMKELPYIIDLSQKLGINHICFAFPHGQGEARKNFMNLIPKYKKLTPILNILIEKAKKSNIKIEFETIPFCIIPHAMQLVGELRYCFGNTLCTQVGEETFNWEKIRLEIKRKSFSCTECDMNMICEGVWSEYYETFGGSELKPLKFPQNIREKILEKLPKMINSNLY